MNRTFYFNCIKYKNYYALKLIIDNNKKFKIVNSLKFE